MGRRFTSQRRLKICRWLYAWLSVLCFALALGERWAIETGTPFVTINAAEALYSSSLYFALRAFFPAGRPLFIAFLTIGIASAIGLPALYRSSWIDRMRDSLPVRLFAGEKIEALDLVRTLDRKSVV